MKAYKKYKKISSKRKSAAKKVERLSKPRKY